MTDFDIIIIGAGPAGMSAALTAANGGLDVLLLDEQPHAGGPTPPEPRKSSGGVQGQIRPRKSPERAQRDPSCTKL